MDERLTYREMASWGQSWRRILAYEEKQTKKAERQRDDALAEMERLRAEVRSLKIEANNPSPMYGYVASADPDVCCCGDPLPGGH